MTHDDAFLDSVAVLALGALPPVEANDVAAHVRTCAECRALYRDLRGAADLVGYAAELAPGRLDEHTAARMKSRVMRAVRGENGTASPTTIPTAGPATARRPRTAWYATLAAAAAVALAVITGLDNLALRSRDAARIASLEAQTSAQARLAAQERARARALDARLAEVLAPNSKHFSVPGGEVVASRGKLVIALQHLPALPAGKVYQAWTLPRGAKTVAPSVTFSPDARGTALVELPEAAASTAAVAVSVEPAGGSKAPTSKPTFVRPLS
jgi:anti-sigma-K factor RskA